jgi:hypothetical protein
VLLAVDLHEDLFDEEGVTEASVLSLQSPGIQSTELDAPEPNRFAADNDASFGQ